MLDNLMSQLSAKVPPAMAVPPVPPEKTKIKTENNNPLLVTVWTPAGNPMQVQAKDAEHAAFLIWANPKPKEKV